jgi:hypothetical protein
LHRGGDLCRNSFEKGRVRTRAAVSGDTLQKIPDLLLLFARIAVVHSCGKFGSAAGT